MFASIRDAAICTKDFTGADAGAGEHGEARADELCSKEESEDAADEEEDAGEGAEDEEEEENEHGEQSALDEFFCFDLASVVLRRLLANISLCYVKTQHV